MKKIFILAFFLFLTNISSVEAYEQATRTCIFKNEAYFSSGGKRWQNYLDVTYMGLGSGIPILGEINYYKLYDDNTKEAIFSYNESDALDYYVNWNKGISGIPTEYSYFTEAIIIQKIDEVTQSDDVSLICPSNIYILEYTDKTGIFNTKIEDRYDLYACGNNYGDYNNDTCQVTRELVMELKKTANHDKSSGTFHTLKYYTGTFVSNVGQEDPTTTDVQEKYNETQEKIETYCEEGTESYNNEECLKANLEQEQYVEQAEEQGVSKETLKKNYLTNIPNADLDFKGDNVCGTYLGDGSKGTPMYYLNFAFNLIKYAAIILLFVLTIVEYARAIPAGKEDAIKKANMVTIKRLIIAVIIFFLPILIEFILELLGISGAGTCGVS